MADVKKIATRDSYGETLVELGKEFDNLIVFDADLAGATKTGTFKKAMPERHFNCGIAEGNMIAVAAGAASMILIMLLLTIIMTMFMLLPTTIMMQNMMLKVLPQQFKQI